MKLPHGATWGDAIALAAAREAVQKGGTLARKDMREAMEGKAPQRLEIHGPEERIKQEIVVTFKQAPINNPRALQNGNGNGEVSVSVTQEQPAIPVEAIAAAAADEEEERELDPK